MKTQRNILIAFLLNLAFSVFEFVGGLVTGSVAIVSDAVHDLGDAGSIAVSYFLEKKSGKQPDERHTYGYRRYSVLGGFFTSLILLAGSAVMIYNAIQRILDPRQIHYDGMILFAVVGVCVNFFAALFTREGGSLNQRAVNLHMLEDVLGWAAVLVGAVVMRFTDFALLDPLLSIGVSVFILINALGNLKEVLGLFLEKTPQELELGELREHLEAIDGVLDVHHIHLWSLDGQSHCATLHVVTDRDPQAVKAAIREELREHGVGHVTVEIETSGESCGERECAPEVPAHAAHCHHHHHHHHNHHHHHHRHGHGKQ